MTKAFFGLKAVAELGDWSVYSDMVVTTSMAPIAMKCSWSQRQAARSVNWNRCS